MGTGRVARQIRNVKDGKCGAGFELIVTYNENSTL